MSGSWPRTPTTVRLRGLTAGVAVLGLTGIGVAVVPQAGASGLDGMSTSTTKPCTGCLDHTVLGFEDGKRGGWDGTNGASVTVSSAFPKSGSKSLVIDSASVGAGAQALITQRLGAAYFGLSVAVAPSSESDGATDRTWVMLTMSTPGRNTYVQIEEVGEGTWTTLGSWHQPLQDGLLMDVRVVQTCGSTTTRRLYLDDIVIATPSGGGAYGQVAAAGASRTRTTSGAASTSTPAATTETTPTTSSPTQTAPACVGSSATPTITGTSPVYYPKEFSFENGKREGWKPMQGVSAKIVGDEQPPAGSKVLELKGTKVPYAGVTWAGRTNVFPGEGPWYRVLLPVRGARTTSTAAGGTPAQVRLSVSGPVAKAVGGIAELPTDGSWTTIDLFFALDESVGTKPAKITLTLGPAPQPSCGTPAPVARVLAIDSVSFMRKQTLPESTSTMQAVVEPQC